MPNVNFGLWLGFPSLGSTVNSMSAAELIRQVAALSPEEKAAFMKLVRQMENGSHENATMPARQWPDFNERLRQIYGVRIAPDSQSIIDDGRGDR
jgi:hypothetical protein